MRVQLSCDRCQTSFSATAAQIRQGRRYCSARCSHEARKEASLVELTCDQCQRPFRVKRSVANEGRRFCSNSCRGRWFGGERSVHWKGVEKTCQWCGNSFHTPPSHADRRKYCSQRCQGAAYSGERNWNWKGGRFVDGQGYIKMLLPDHPAAWPTGYIHEHTVVAMEKIGRALRPGETVHHVDGDKTNNAPGNLVVLTRSEHARIHLSNG